MVSFSSSKPLQRLSIAALTALVMSFLLAAPGLANQADFATPDQAVDALMAAVRSGSTTQLLAILGTSTKDVVSSGDKVYDTNIREQMIGKYDEAHQIAKNGDDRATLDIGKDQWPFPYPLVKTGKTWRFDTQAGTQEILDRRIGANELDAIQVCHAYVDAQRDYAAVDRNHDGYIEYAQKFLSASGKHDGLYWPTDPGEEESPLGPLVVAAQSQGYKSSANKTERAPYHGYYYKILTAQGPAAKDGAYSYVIKGHMMAGFALVAYPAQYGASGIMTFIVNHDDVVYQKNLGSNTAEIASRMTTFNPDSSWTKVSAADNADNTKPSSP